MTYLAEAGFPVPRVYDADGPTWSWSGSRAGTCWLTWPAGRGWSAATPGPWPGCTTGCTRSPRRRRCPQRHGSGDRVLHLDLHPGNVMLTPSGPVVIDWTGAASGAPAVDVAMVQVIIATSDVDALPRRIRPAVAALRSVLLRQYLAAVQDDPAPVLARVARARMADPNVRPAEVRRLEEIADRAERQAAEA